MASTEDIINIIKNQVLKEAMLQSESYKISKKRNLSPSSDFMCMRKTFFDFKYSGNSALEIDPRDFKYESIRATNVGNNFHNFMEKVCREAGILRLSEVDLIDEKHRIKARLDMVVEIDKTLFLVELKSAQEYSIKLMSENGNPDIEHQKQIQLYFHLLETNKDNPEIFAALNGRKVRRGLLLYENKNKHKLTPFIVNKNQVIIDEILDYSKKLFEYIDRGKEPSHKLDPESFECKYKCKARYYELCHGKPNPMKEEIRDDVWGTSSVKELMKSPKFEF